MNLIVVTFGGDFGEWPEHLSQLPNTQQKEITVQKLIGLFCLVFLLSACGKSEQRLCEASFKETLLNPETAEFHDFSPETTPVIRESIWLGITRQGLVRQTWPDIENKKEADPGTTYYQMRVRAEGAMGNKVTKPLLCLIPPSGETCVCAAVETSFSF